MKQVLMVAEKPSIAESLAKALSGGKYSQRKGISPSVPVFEFEGDCPLVLHLVCVADN